MSFRRLPIESAQPILVFAVARLAIAVAALLALVVLGFPYDGRGAAAVGGLAVPWAVWCLVQARREPERLLNPLVPAVDLLVLVMLELLVPETYGAVRVVAVFLIAAHAHFQGERRGVMIALLGSVALVPPPPCATTSPSERRHAFYETVFVVSCLATGLVVGSLRTAESASRLRARSLSRRTIQAEAQVRRRVAETIHDGPVQELIGLDMMLSSARKAAAEGRADDATRLLDEARELTERNVGTLRDELVDLGPYAFEELPSRPRSRTACRSGSDATASRCWRPSTASIWRPRPPACCSASPRRRSSTPGAIRARTRSRSRCGRSTRAWSCA